jgi:hypothetical protein
MGPTGAPRPPFQIRSVRHVPRFVVSVIVHHVQRAAFSGDYLLGGQQVLNAKSCLFIVEHFAPELFCCDRRRALQEIVFLSEMVPQNVVQTVMEPRQILRKCQVIHRGSFRAIICPPFVVSSLEMCCCNRSQQCENESEQCFRCITRNGDISSRECE